MGWIKRIGKAILGVALAAVILGGGYVGSVAIRRAKPVTFPAIGGAYAVGRLRTEWTDTSRTDPLAPASGSPRELAVWLWYPAPAGTTGPRAAYAPGEWAALQIPVGETSFGAVRVRSIESAPVAAGRFPLVVLEPGLGLAAPQYTGIAENLAAQGYVVAGVTPTYSANTTVLHGKVVGASAAGNPTALNADDLHAPAAEKASDDLLQVWAADARFAAGAVTDRGGMVAAHVDPARIAYIGHSFGGAASLQACHDDPHCVAAADLDGTQFGPVVHTGLRPPVLIMETESRVAGIGPPATAADRSDLATARTLLAAGTGPAQTYRVDGMRHFDFTDYDAYFVAGPLRRLLALGSLPRGRGITITDAYLSAFLDRAVRGRADPAPTGYPEVLGG
jgi:predicted dienelactone hydrolase